MPTADSGLKSDDGDTLTALCLLYLDDSQSEHIFLRSMAARITGMTLELRTATTIEEALALMTNGDIDVCLIDYDLNDAQGRNGADFIREALAADACACPFILLTVGPEREADLEGLRAGAIAHLEKKHLRPELLERTLRYAVDQFRTRQKLEALYTQVRQLEEFKANLLRVAGHNLKGYLTNVRLSLRMLLKLVPEDDLAANRNALRINHSLTSMEQLTNDILTLERIDLGGKMPEHDVDIVALVTEVCVNHRQQMLKAGQHLIFSPDGQPFHVRCEPTQLRELVANLISNAIKYTPEGGTITVKVVSVPVNGSPTSECVQLEVSDTGYGIPDDQQDRLFEPFYRVKLPQTENIQGTGLGLYLVKTLVERHGGSVGFESHPGQGSRFWLRLPRVTSDKKATAEVGAVADPSESAAQDEPSPD